MSPTERAVAAPKKPMTADEFWEFCQRPENENKLFELIRGEVVELPRPNKKHGYLSGNIARVIGNYSFQVGVGYMTSNDTGVLLEEDPDTVVGPDVAYYTDANTFDELHPKWGEEPPVLAVEVLSPNDKMSRVNAKVRDYLANGVKLVWLVDPDERKVTVYRPDRSLDVLDESAELTGGDDLPGFTCRVADLFLMPGDGPPPQPAPPPTP